jgi:UDP-N-acetylmuramoylalanine--D-glutamate ligase
MKGARIGVFGLARSGLSVAKAAMALGAFPTIVEEKEESALKHRLFLDEALQVGAKVDLGWKDGFDPRAYDLIVKSPGVPRSHSALVKAEEDGIQILGEIEFAYLISKAPIVAITGTNGKSTTTVMVHQCLLRAGIGAILCGNIYGSGYVEVPLTEAALNASAKHILVAEVSSFQLETASLFKPIAAAITNITPDHLDRHKTFEEYAEAKQRIFKAQGARDFAVVPEDSSVIRRPVIPEVLTFGKEGATAWADGEKLSMGPFRVALSSLPFVGGHNHDNACVAVLLASAAVSWMKDQPFAFSEDAVEGLKQFKGIEHRMELVGERLGVKVINNSMCTNPAAVISSSGSLKEHQHLLLGGSNKKLDFKPLQKYLETSYNRAYLFGRDAEALNEQLGGGHPVFETMAEAFQDAVRNANAGEVVMLAPGCASMDQFDDFRARGNVFKAIAKEWLES